MLYSIIQTENCENGNILEKIFFLKSDLNKKIMIFLFFLNHDFSNPVQHSFSNS